MVCHLHPVGHGGAQLLGDAVYLPAKQQIGLDGVDLVATADAPAILIACRPVANRPRIAATQRVWIRFKVAAFKVLDQLQGRSQIGLFAVLAPDVEPCPIAPHSCCVTVDG